MGKLRDRLDVVRRPAASRTIAMAGVAGLAVAIVVALALIGTSSHAKQRVTTATTTSTTAPNPDPTPTPSLVGRSVTYVNTMVPISYGGMARTYLLSRPATRTRKKLPVIMVLHGRDASPALEQQRTDFASVVSPSILVYPTGFQESWNAGGCCGGAQAANLNDVGFIATVLKAVKQTQADASQGRAYLAGYSNGGKMALAVACRDSGDFAAVAVYGATDAESCPARAPSNVLEMGGSTDPTVPADATAPAPESNGFFPPSFEAEVNSYRVADGCAANPVLTTVGQVTLSSWVHCADTTRVGQAVFAGSSHGWPAGSATSPSAEGVAWAWFSSLGA